MYDHPDRIPVEVCVRRTVYLVCARQLRVAVCVGGSRGGFIGIDAGGYLFTEHHWDRGGSLNPLTPLTVLPADVEVRTSEPTVCDGCRARAHFDRPRSEGGRGWRHADGSSLCDGAFPVSEVYRPLFDELRRLEDTLPDPDR